MTWTKLADGLPRHPKIVGLTDAAFRLHIYALCYASEQLTDGEIPAVSVAILAPKRAKKLVEELVNAGVWHDETHECFDCPELVPGRYYLHGFLNYNPPAERVEADRAAARERMQRARRGRSSPEQPPNVRENVERTSASPSRPVPTHSEFISSSIDARGVPEAADDEEDPRYCTVLESRISKRMNGRDGIANPKAYRATVLAELLDEAARTRKLLADFPTAPAQSIAGFLDGETSTLAAYRPKATA